MTRINKSFLFAIPLFFILFSCSVGNNGVVNKSTNTDSYKFANLIQPNAFYTPPPAGICADVPINRNPYLQSPEVNCNLNSPGFHSQIAYGCNVESNTTDNLGNRLFKSVVGIALPVADSYWRVDCTGTVIESTWILTAAHCLANFIPDDTRGKFDHNIQNLMVIPWQSAYNGVPNDIISESTNVVKFPVKAIYIPYHFNFYQENSIRPYSDYLKDDFALIELESALSNDYKPIPLESKEFNLPQNSPLWAAGYGDNESQAVDGQLHYQQIYYYSNRYNTSPEAWIVGNLSVPGPSLESGANYGMIYTLGSIPESKENQLPAAWSFLGFGDSGGPLLHYNQTTQKFSIWATLTGDLYCNYAGFYARLPFPFDQNTAINDSRYTLIQQIMNEIANRAAVRCRSKNNSCYPKTSYVLNRGSDSVTVYNFDSNNTLHLMQTITTGANPQAFTFDASHSYLLVANDGNTQADQGSISVFKINLNGSLSPNSPGQFNFEINKPVDITINNTEAGINAVESSDHNIYVANQGNSSIVKLVINHDDGALFMESLGYLQIPNLNRIKFDFNILYAFDSIDSKIFMIDKSLQSNHPLSGDFNLPTDLSRNRRNEPLVVNSGTNSILNINSGISIDSHGDSPNQIIKYHDFYYASNLASNNIAIFKYNGNESLVFTNAITTGKEPINMMITESQLWITNLADDSVWYYNILPDGNLEFKESAATGLEPVAVLVN